MSHDFNIGFEGGSNLLVLPPEGTGGNVDVVTDYVHGAGLGGQYSLKIRPIGSSSFCDLSARVDGNVAPSYTDADIAIRFYLYFVALPSATQDILTFQASFNTLYARFMFHQTSGKLSVGFGGSPTHVDGPTVTTGTWYLIDLKIRLGVNPHTIDWRVNGSTQTQATASETAVTSSDPRTLYLGPAGPTDTTYDIRIDDFISSSDIGKYPFGAGYGKALKPNGVGTHNNTGHFQNDNGSDPSTNSWSRLDDIPYNETDYVKQVTAGAADYLEYTFEDIGAGLSANGASCFLVADDVEGDFVGAILGCHARDGSTDTLVVDPANAGSYPGFYGVWAGGNGITPASGWSASVVNALKARIGYQDPAIVTSYAQTNTPLFSDLYLEADIVGEPVGVFPVTHGVDAVLQTPPNTVYHTVDADLLGTPTVSHLVDALIYHTVVVAHSTDAYIEARPALPHRTDALITSTTFLPGPQPLEPAFVVEAADWPNGVGGPEIPVYDLTGSEVLDDSSALSFRCPDHDSRVTPEILPILEKRMDVYRRGVLVWSGRLASFNVSVEEGLQFGATGWYEELKRVYVQPSDVLQYFQHEGSVGPWVDAIGPDATPIDIMWALIKYANSYNGLGFTLGADTGEPPKPRNYEFDGFSTPSIDDAIHTTASRPLLGVDFWVTPRREWRTTRRSYEVVSGTTLERDVNIEGLSNQGAGADSATSVIIIGQGDGADALWAKSIPDATLDAKYGFLQIAFDRSSYPYYDVPGDLTAAAANLLASQGQPQYNPQVAIKSDAIPWDAFDLTDRVPIVWDDGGYVKFAGESYRCIAKVFNWDSQSGREGRSAFFDTPDRVAAP